MTEHARLCANPACRKPLSRRNQFFCSKACYGVMASGQPAKRGPKPTKAPDRYCQAPGCTVRLKPRQVKYCCTACAQHKKVHINTEAASRIWEFKLSHPEMTNNAIARHFNVDPRHCVTIIYGRKNSPWYKGARPGGAISLAVTAEPTPEPRAKLDRHALEWKPRGKCAHGVDDIYTQCPERTMLGSRYCFKHRKFHLGE